MILSAYLNRKC